MCVCVRVCVCGGGGVGGGIQACMLTPPKVKILYKSYIFSVKGLNVCPKIPFCLLSESVYKPKL